MRITLHQLKVFAKVAEFQSVTAAANHLHMTQPAVSNIIRQLEDYYDCKLIEIVGRRLFLTAFGKILFSGSHELESVLDTLHTDIGLLKGGLCGTLSVATVSTAKYFIPQLLGTFRHQYPEVHIRLTVGNRSDIIKRVEDNLDDFVIMSHPPSAILVDCANFYDDELVIAAAKDNELTQNKNLLLKDLKSAPWIVREMGSGTRYATENIFKKKRFSPDVAMELGDNEAIKQAIMADIGISVISKLSIQLELRNRLICLLSVKGFPVKHRWYLVKNKGKSLSPVAENFYAFVNKHQPIFNKVY